jgi:ATP-dependent Lon protease
MVDVLVAAVSPYTQSKSVSVLHFSSLSINISALAFLTATDVEDRLRRATEHFVKQSSIQEVSKKIASAGDESSRRS